MRGGVEERLPRVYRGLFELKNGLEHGGRIRQIHGRHGRHVCRGVDTESREFLVQLVGLLTFFLDVGLEVAVDAITRVGSQLIPVADVCDDELVLQTHQLLQLCDGGMGLLGGAKDPLKQGLDLVLPEFVRVVFNLWRLVVGLLDARCLDLPAQVGLQ